MAFRGLREFIKLLESENELVRISCPVNPELEITEIVDRIVKNRDRSKALLFENNGSDFPLIINAFGSEKRMGLALRYDDLNEVSHEIERMFKVISNPPKSYLGKLKILPMISTFSAGIPHIIRSKGKCQEVIMGNPDLTKLPILKCWPADGGNFITLPCVVTRDPENGMRNIGMYRMQVFDKNTTGMHWHKHKTGARHYSAYKRKGMKMPVSVFLGGDPVYTYAATAPLPDNFDEYSLAGFLRKRKVELVKCITNDLEVPSDADFVIEGYVDPEEDLIWEGPFGDHTGFYSLADWYPQFHVTCITHRRDAVYPATIVGIPPQEDTYIGKATERFFLAPMKLTMIPELLDIDLPPSGVAHNITIVKINKTYAGQSQKVMNAIWGAGQMMFNKILIVTDDNVDIHNYRELIGHAIKVVNPQTDVIFSQGPLDVLDHSSARFAFGSKMGIDLTIKSEEEIVKENEHPVDLLKISESTMEGVHKIPGILYVNWNLIKEGISVLIIGVRKNQDHSVPTIADELLSFQEMLMVKFFLFVDSELDVYNFEAVSWYVASNIDPSRDCRIVKPSHEFEQAHLMVDGTRKLSGIDGFKRDWPNPVISSPETIKIVDQLWPKLGLGEFIPSPSLNYMALKNGDGAVSIS